MKHVEYSEIGRHVLAISPDITQYYSVQNKIEEDQNQNEGQHLQVLVCLHFHFRQCIENFFLGVCFNLVVATDHHDHHFQRKQLDEIHQVEGLSEQNPVDGQQDNAVVLAQRYLLEDVDAWRDYYIALEK